MNAIPESKRHSILLTDPSIKRDTDVLFASVIHNSRNKIQAIIGYSELHTGNLSEVERKEITRALLDIKEEFSYLEKNFNTLEDWQKAQEVRLTRRRIPMLLAALGCITDLGQEARQDYNRCFELCQQIVLLIQNLEEKVRGDRVSEMGLLGQPSRLLNEVAERYARLYPTIEFEVICLPSREIYLIEESLRQALENMILNAIQALPGESGKIMIRGTKKLVVEENRLFDAIEAGEYYSIQVQDNGSGIPEAIISELPRSGVTTKEHGSGVGLQSVRASMIQHGGHLYMESEKGYTCVTALIPTDHPSARNSSIRPVARAQDALSRALKKGDLAAMLQLTEEDD